MLKQRKKPARPRVGRKSVSDVVIDLAASGQSEDAIAFRLGVHKNTLRARWITELDAGRAIAKAKPKPQSELTRSERWILRDMAKLQGTHWWPETGCLLYLGTDGRCAKTIADAFLAWRVRGVVGSTGNQSESPEQKAEAEKIYRAIILEIQTDRIEQ
jgi:hypothetical protein